MVEEVLAQLDPKPGKVIVDATAGTGGHSVAILPRLLPDGLLMALDQDEQALAQARTRLAAFEPHVRYLHGNFRDLSGALKTLQVEAIDGLLLDLGMSSLHVDEPERGFSFLREGPLDMRMDPGQGRPASALVNAFSEMELAHLLRTLGEERFAQRIARRIVAERKSQPFMTTTQLARTVTLALPPQARHGRLHAATRTFQALRMAVNDELGALETLLAQAPTLLRSAGRLVILTYHSLEDRLVKRAFLQGQREGRWRLLTKKPLTPGREEQTRNPRARSAKLRAVERC